MRDYKEEFDKRVAFIKDVLKTSGASGIVFGNSGGKDSALVGILCKAACDNTIGIIMPCSAKRNFTEDMEDGAKVATQFSIKSKTVDLTPLRELLVSAIADDVDLTQAAISNIAPRLRMTTLYTVAAAENLLVAGTGNKSEMHMGYFTKWGDGAYDFNPIGDLTVTEIFEFLKFLNAPDSIVHKAPSGGLFDGQTDEGEMGVTYDAIDGLILKGIASKEDKEVIERYHKNTAHKRRMPLVYGAS